MKKLLISAYVFFFLSFSGSFAHATASPYFAYDPNSTSGGAVDLSLPWQGVNSSSANGNHYGRNVYWTFSSTSPVGTGKSLPGASYFGVEDKATSGLTSDSVADTGINVLAANEFGVTGGKSTGTGNATFTLGNTNLAANNNFTMYYYVEATYSLTAGFKGTTSSITFTLPGISNSDFFINGVSQGSSGTSGTADTFTLSTATLPTNEDSGTFDAWFEFNSFPTSDALNIAFTGGAGNGGGNSAGSAYISSLHIATTPEPMAMALFATGVGVLFFVRRRRFAFQRA